MLSAADILHIIKTVILVTALLLGLLYLCLILLNRRRPSSMNILMINVCVASILCTCFWIIYNLLEMTHSPLMRYDQLCWFYSYSQNVSVCEVVYAFCVISFHRYLIVVYNTNLYFKRHRWAMICTFIQWLIGGLLPIPLWFSKRCDPFGIPWSFQIYKFIIVIIVPLGFTVSINGILFLIIRQSTLRVQPTGVSNGISTRDARLLKHMIFVILIYVCTWGPIYITAVADKNNDFPTIIYGILNILPSVGLLIGIIDLFLYNNQVKHFLTHSTLSTT